MLAICSEMSETSLPKGWHPGDVVLRKARPKRPHRLDDHLGIIVKGFDGFRRLLIEFVNSAGNEEQWYIPVDQLHKTEPRSQWNGWNPGSWVAFNGASEDFRDGDKLVHGAEGRIVVRNMDHEEGYIGVHFPRNKTPILCPFESLSAVPSSSNHPGTCLKPGDLVEALPPLFEARGVEHYRAGDTGTVAAVNSYGVAVVWARTGLMSMRDTDPSVWKFVRHQTLGLHDEVQALPATRIDKVCEPGDRGFVKAFVVKDSTAFVEVVWQSQGTHLFPRARWMDYFWRFRGAPPLDQGASDCIRCQVSSAIGGQILIPDLCVSRRILGLELMLEIGERLGLRLEEQSLLIAGRPLEEGEAPLADHPSDVTIQFIQRPPREATSLSSSDWKARKEAVDSLGARENAARLIAHLVPMLQDKEPRVQIAALFALSQPALHCHVGDSLRAQWDRISQAVNNFLEHDQVKVRVASAELAALVRPEMKHHIILLASEISQCRVAAVQALGRDGVHAAQHAGKLVSMLADEEPRVRDAITDTVRSRYAQTRDRAIWNDAMCELLRKADRDGILQARVFDLMHGLEGSGNFFAGLTADLGQQKGVRMRAIEILKGLAAVPHATSIAEALCDRFADVRIAAARALADLGEAGRFVRQFVTLLADPDRAVRGVAVEVLSNLGEVALPGVTELLSHESSTARSAAARTLRGMGLVAKPEADKLRALLHDSDKAVREAVAQALKAVEGGSAEMKERGASGDDAGVSDKEVREAAALASEAVQGFGVEMNERGAGGDDVSVNDKEVQEAAALAMEAVEGGVIEMKELGAGGGGSGAGLHAAVGGSAASESGPRATKRRWGRDRSAVVQGGHARP